MNKLIPALLCVAFAALSFPAVAGVAAQQSEDDQKSTLQDPAR